MGQLLDRDAEEEEQPHLQLTWGQDSGETSESSSRPEDKLHQLAIPDAPPFPLLGLEETRLFLTDNLTVPVEYNRRQREGFSGKSHASAAEYRAGMVDLIQSSYVRPSKIMTIMGRAGTGKRSLIREVCSKFDIGLLTLSTAADLLAFELDKVHRPEVSPPTLREYVLVIESSALESVREALKTQQLLEQVQQLPVDSPLQSVIFLLHDYEAFERFNLHRVTGIHILNMYARVPNYTCRKQLIATAISKFEQHKLLAHMSNFVSFHGHESESAVTAIANASAWYTPQEIVSFLDRCFNDVLIELIPYSNMERIPPTIPAVNFLDIVQNYLAQTKDVISQRNKTNGYKVPNHPIYGERPYAINDQDVAKFSTPFENGFHLKAVDVEDATWLHIVNSRLYAKLQGISNTHKRKADAAVLSDPTPPSHKPYESAANVTITRQNLTTSFLNQ